MPFTQICPLGFQAPRRRLGAASRKRAVAPPNRIVSEGLGAAEKSTSEFATLGADWLDASLRSLWSGGRALLSIFSVLIVTPIIALYLICDWKRMVAAIDSWIPPTDRETVRALACQIDDTVSGFIRGQILICLVLASYYAMAGIHDRRHVDAMPRGVTEGDRIWAGLRRAHQDRPDRQRVRQDFRQREGDIGGVEIGLRRGSLSHDGNDRLWPLRRYLISR